MGKSYNISPESKIAGNRIRDVELMGSEKMITRKRICIIDAIVMGTSKFHPISFITVFLLLMGIMLLSVKKSESQFVFKETLSGLNTLSGDSAHWNESIPCLTCHVLNGAPGDQLTAVAGNTNLCMSCHNPVGMASNTPFTNADRAEPGIGGTSHAWNKPAINETYGANFPTNANMAEKVMYDDIVCSTCHNPHVSNFDPFLRTSNVQDAMCKDCHSVRDIGTFVDDPNNKGSHPVGKTYPATDARFFATPQNPDIILIGSQVECSSCHGIHFTNSGGANGGTGDGYLLRTSNDDNLCTSCHTYSSHQGMGCTQCHQTHNPNRANIYMLKDTVDTPSSGLKPVLFYRESGPNSFADGDTNYDGICEVCHTQTDHFRNDGSAPDQHHANFGGLSGNKCVKCHLHNLEFESTHPDPGPGTDCIECHGHNAGYEYAPGQFSQGAGTANSHSTHTENDADDLKGPFIGCADCHDTNNYPYFVSGTDADGDGKYSLVETDVCNNCHSPGGTYNGVDNLTFGAKNNWELGIYSNDSIPSGKEKWCASCHDESPANSMIDGSGILGPKVVGNEDASSIYGTGYGYYKTGHGLADSLTYLASGGITAGAGLSCSACHDYSTAHIDHIARTFDDGDLSTTDPAVYRAGYRLNLVDGFEPMQIPLPQNTSPLNNADQFRLCYSCHDTGPFLSGANMNTNLVTNDVNRHQYHLNMNQLRYPSDWSGVNNSRVSCVTCHNVHGSPYLTMTREGELIGREPGLQIWYNNDNVVTYNTTNPDPPEPQDLPLTASTGTAWIGKSSGNLCTHCHANGNTLPEYRIPFQNVNKAPWLEWASELDFENDGLSPDTAVANATFLFKVKYFDLNNDFPDKHLVLVDRDGDGILDSVNLNVTVGDNNFTNGSVYYATVNIALPPTGPGNVNYRFYFISTDSVATGVPTNDHQFNIKNNPPVLDWTGNLFFESDGVHPNMGPAGNFEFEIKYTDLDGDIPPSVNLIIDDVWPGYAMTAGSGSIVGGKTYSQTVSLLSPGSHTYRFSAKDNAVWGDDATLDIEPLSNNPLTVTNTSNQIPILSYVSETCFTKGVMPVRGPVEGDYDFNIIYTDFDNEAPTSIKVIIDGVDEYPLTAISGDILTGMTYGTTIQVNTVGEHSYHFYASDGQDAAIGDPATVNGDTVSVINAAKVKLNETRPGWYGSIQAAIDDLTDTIIMVYPATYNENILINSSTNDDKLTLEAVCGADNTIIDAPGNTIFLQNIPTFTKIIGFTITGGTNGFYINGCKPEIVNCVIRNNTDRGINSSNPGNSITLTNTIVRDNNETGANANGYGAGLFLNGGTTHLIVDCVFSNNHASERGGGIFAQNISVGNVTMIGTEVSNNSSLSAGGGVYTNNTNIIIKKCKIISNTAHGGVAGGLFAQGTDRTVDISNSIIANNSGSSGAGFWFNSAVIVTIANAVFEGNVTSDTVSGRGGALFTYDSDPVITNTIFWNNKAGSNTASGHHCFAHSGGAVFTFHYSNITNNSSMLSGNGTFVVDSTNLATDPLFQDAANFDFSLKAVSPCIDFGTITGAPLDDIIWQARGIDGRGDGKVTGDLSDYDIGAYEYNP